MASTTSNLSKKIIGILMLLLPFTGFSQEEAITSSGKTVLLFPDSTWKLKVQLADTTRTDSVALPKPEKQNKPYSDSTTGFKGFLKPALRLPALPEQSAGVYEFRVKIDKEGYVKEVITTHHGNNGEAEKLMRNAITRMKFMHNGSVVPPLTDGTIRITVPPGR